MSETVPLAPWMALPVARSMPATTSETVPPAPWMALPVSKPAKRASPQTTALRQAQPARTTDLREGFRQCALPTEGHLQGETVGRTRTAPPASTDGVFSSEAATWGVLTTSVSKTRTARATCPANVVTRRRVPTATGASSTATVASMTTAALGATARPANSTVACECAPCNVIQERTVMQERRRCPVGAARVVVTATSALRQTTPARTTASVRGIVPAPTSPREAGPASPAPKFLEVRLALERPGKTLGKTSPRLTFFSWERPHQGLGKTSPRLTFFS